MTGTTTYRWVLRGVLITALLVYPTVSNGMVLCIDAGGHGQIEIDDGSCCEAECYPTPRDAVLGDIEQSPRGDGLKHVELSYPGLTRSTHPISRNLGRNDLTACPGLRSPSVDADPSGLWRRSPSAATGPNRAASLVGITVLIC